MVGLTTINAHNVPAPSPALFIVKELGPGGTSSLTRRAEQRLQESPFGTIRQVRCRLKEEDGTVELVGCVPDYYSKQLAQETIRSLPGLRSIHNHLTVVGSATHRVS